MANIMAETCTWYLLFHFLIIYLSSDFMSSTYFVDSVFVINTMGMTHLKDQPPFHSRCPIYNSNDTEHSHIHTHTDRHDYSTTVGPTYLKPAVRGQCSVFVLAGGRIHACTPSPVSNSIVWVNWVARLCSFLTMHCKITKSIAYFDNSVICKMMARRRVSWVR